MWKDSDMTNINKYYFDISQIVAELSNLLLINVPTSRKYAYTCIYVVWDCFTSFTACFLF